MTAQRRFDAIFVGRDSRTGVSEGLNVLFADLIRNLLALNVPVTIYTTGRHVAGLVAVLRANGVDEQTIDIRPLIPGSRVLERAWSGHSEVKHVGLRARLSRWAMSTFRTARLSVYLAWLLDSSAVSLPIKLLGLFVATLCAIAILTLTGVGVLGLLTLYGGYRLSIKMARWAGRVSSKFFKKPNGEPLAITRAHVSRWIHNLRLAVYERLYYLESNRFAAALKGRREVRTCFFHNAFEGYIVDALGPAKKKLVVFPDAVTAMFPTRFPLSRHDRNVIAAVVTSVRKADAVVCYSNYVRDRQLRALLDSALAGKRIEVIPQGFFLEKSHSESCSIRVLNGLVKDVVGSKRARGELQFGSFEYVLYPSVDRPHKNTLTLLRAVEHLIRNHQINIKLVTTSHSATEDLRAYIAKQHLEREIIFMPMLPIEKLNSLIQGALAVVHPSLAEGGDIFNFSRAASHGCPALLSDIEVAREMFERHGISRADYGKWLFNPVSPKQLARKILDVRARRLSYVAEQAQALRALATYSYADMAKKYHEVYCSI